MGYLFKNRVLAIIIVAILGTIVYANTVESPFVFDDTNNIVENPIIRDLRYFQHPTSARHFTEAVEYPMLIKRYVGVLSFALNYRLHGLDVTGYHIVNIAIHILNALLVYSLVLLTFRTPFMARSRLKDQAPQIALLASALFVAHPVQTQAVTYIVQRFASLATLFYLASLVCYIRSRLAEKRGQRIAFYGLSILAAVLGMKTKEIVFTLPLAVLLYELFFFQGERKRRLLYWAPIGLTLLVIPLTLVTMKDVGAMQGETLKVIDLSQTEYLFTESRVLVTYLRLLVAPLGQTLMYDYPIYTSALDPSVLLSILVHLGVLGLGVYLFARSRHGEPAWRVMAMGIFWFYLTLSVESTLVPLHPIYEHRMYLPSAGVFGAFSAGAFLVLQTAKTRVWRRTVITVMLIIPLVLGVAAFARNSVWHSEVSLWEDGVQKSPASIFTHTNLAHAYKKIHRDAEAITHLQRAISLPAPRGREAAMESFRIEALMHIGDSYRILGEAGKAIESYNAALDAAPEGIHAPQALNNIGVIYLQYGKQKEAAEYFSRVVQLAPTMASAHFNLGLTLYRMGNTQEAIIALRNAVKLDPSSRNALSLLQQLEMVK